MARKQTIYVSSTFADLKVHRATLKTELERAGYDVESMERYAAYPEPPLPQTLVDKGKAAKQLGAFRQRLEEAHGRSEFTDLNNLTKQVLSALHGWHSRAYMRSTTWDFTSYMADNHEVFVGRDSLFGEIAVWQATADSRAMLFCADFGVGKSIIMAEPVHRNPGGAVAPWHCCLYNTPETLPSRLVRQKATTSTSALWLRRNCSRPLRASHRRRVVDRGAGDGRAVEAECHGRVAESDAQHLAPALGSVPNPHAFFPRGIHKRLAVGVQRHVNDSAQVAEGVGARAAQVRAICQRHS